KGLAALGVQHLFAQRVCVSQRNERVGDLLGESRLQVPMRGKTTVTVPWARPDDAEGVLQRLAWRRQSFECPSTHGTRIIGPCAHELDDRPLLRQRTRLALLGKGTGGQIPLRIEAMLFQEILTNGVSLLHTIQHS